MANAPKEKPLLYLALGIALGAVVGGIAGMLFFEDRPGGLLVSVGAGALVFGVLGILFRERVVEFFPWY